MGPQPLTCTGVWVLVLFLVVTVGAPLVFVVFARYSYTIEGEFLIIRRRILGAVPCGTVRIALDCIQAVQVPPPYTCLAPGLILPYVNVGALEGVLIVLRKRRYGLFRRAFLTPEDVPAFLDMLAARIGEAAITRPQRGPIYLDRLPVRIADAIAASTGIVTLLLLGSLVAQHVWGRPPMSAVHGLPSSLSLLIPVLGTLCVGLLPLLMVLDCARAFAEEEDPVLLLWLVGMLVFFPLAWVYYLRKWRPRRVGRNSGPSR